MVDRCRLRVRYRCYRYRRREESWGLEVPGVALARLALARLEGLAEAADRFRQGSAASALVRHRGESWALVVPPVALARLAGLAKAADGFRQGPRQALHQGPRPSSAPQVLTRFPDPPPHLRLEVGRAADR